MSYSDKNPRFDRMRKGLHDTRIQWEAARAREIQQNNSKISRDEALKQASAEYEFKE